MRVTNRNPTSASTEGTSGSQEIQRSGSGSNSSARAGAGGDTVELSATIGSLSRAMESFGSDRQSKVESLAAQYQAGTYTIDSVAISRGIIAEAMVA